MTDNSKNNLLKVLLNQAIEQPGENIPNYIDMGSINNNIGNLIETSDFAKFRGTPYRVFYRNGQIFAYNSDIIIHTHGNTVEATRLNSAFYNYRLIDVFQDTDGIYGLIVENSKVKLVYFNDWSIPEASGDYDVYKKISYDITSILTTVTGDSSPQSCFFGQLKLNKSPLDGRFLIFTSLSNQTYFSAIVYKVSVGTANTYEYSRISKSSFNVSLPKCDDMYVAWTNNGMNFSAGIIGTSAVIQTTGSDILYEIKGSLSGLTYSTLQNISNCVKAPLNAITSYTPQIRYRSLTDRFISYVTVDTSLNKFNWYGGDIVLKRINGSTQTTLRTTHSDYVQDNSGNTYKNENNIIIIDNNVFAVETKLTSENTIEVNLEQLIDNTIHSSKIIDNLTYVRNDSLSYSYIINRFNLYDFNFQLDNYLFSVRAIYRPNGYNGAEYLGDGSVTSVSGVLYNDQNVPVFARDLYNKIKIGNTISSIIHVPKNDLSNEIILTKDLMSVTNSIIDTDSKEIDKNQYEELYINFLDSFKVIDNNEKSTYRVLATNNVVNEIISGSFDFKVTNYRINYEDGTYLDRPINHVSINDNIATLEIYVSIEDKKINNIEIFDSNYITSFASIDLSSYNEGIYKLTEYVKVE